MSCTHPNWALDVCLEENVLVCIKCKAHWKINSQFIAEKFKEVIDERTDLVLEHRYRMESWEC